MYFDRNCNRENEYSKFIFEHLLTFSPNICGTILKYNFLLHIFLLSYLKLFVPIKTVLVLIGVFYKVNTWKDIKRFFAWLREYRAQIYFILKSKEIINKIQYCRPCRCTETAFLQDMIKFLMRSVNPREKLNQFLNEITR